jgi:hypothetical protein
MLTSRTSRLALLTTLGALLAAASTAPGASADTFCVHGPSGCAGSAKPDLNTALASANANGAGKDTIMLGAGSFADGPAVAAAGNPVEIVGTSAQDTTLVGSGNNITVLKLLDGASTVSNLGVKITGTGDETGIELAGKGSHLRITNSGAQTASKGVLFSGAFPWLDASSVALSYNPNDVSVFGVYSAAIHSTISDSELSAMRGVYLYGGQVDVVRSRVWAQQGLTATSSGASYATASDTSFRAPGPSQSNYSAYALAATGNGWNTIDADRVTALGTGNADVGAVADPKAQAGNHATIHIRGSAIDGFGKALSASQSNGASSTITSDWSAYKLGSIMLTGGATYTPAASNLDLTGLGAGFLGAAGGDPQLRHDSPLVDRGDPAFQPAGALDRDGRPRLRDGDGAGGPRADIGAMEYQRSAPIAAATATPPAVDPGQVISFNGKASDADPGETPTYHWAFDDGGSAQGASAQHTFTSAGTHTATLTVTDPAGLTGVAQVTVKVNAPGAPAPSTGSTTQTSTTQASTAATPTAARAFAGVKLVSTRLSFGGRFIALKLSCPAGTVGRCSGRTKLTARRRAASRAASSVTLGRAPFSIAAGRQAKVKVRVSRVGRRLLTRVRRLRGKDTNAARDGAGGSKTTATVVTIRRRQR